MLDYFFNPKGIAVIGASNDPKKLGYEVFKNLKQYKGGNVYPVNVREEEVQGVKAYKSVKDIPGEVDLAIIVVPKKFVKDTLIQCGEKGVKGVVIITAGFGETGEEGKKEEKELVEIAHRYGMRIIGPNCVGIMNTHADLNATFITVAKKGNVAFISQSGALGAGIVYKTIKEDIGFSKFISVGNMADLDFAELMEYLADTEEDKAIALYIEGIRNGRKFIEVAKRVTKKKPVIALKAGKSESGARAASSHTGSLAGSWKIYEAAFKQSGVLVANTIDEMLSMARAFTQPLPRGKRVAIMTNAGGPGVLTADELDKRGLKLANLEEKTIEELRSFLPPMAAVKNPVDMIASARGEDYYRTAKLLLQDPNVDMLIAICVVPTFAGMTPTEHAEGIIRAIKEVNNGKPVLAMFMAGYVSEKAKELLEKNGIPTYERPEDVASAAYALVEQAKNVGVLEVE
ncbi:acetate--CoA ligase I subunit alpha [Pyrococcus abyssi]|uniref:acetate--CoA ligase (ADP-forming) n=1 Tax=Pyrococcus abyssi (strain GE5 / Orsay) TaxID=272844 RepID=Q9UZ58_PYRAB|nr:acetate--CoA ligase I subunit alpha [Pyrococcus abyssi]CAB50201.1 acdA-3 acetate--coA ligase (ADP-forming) (EC 6.2.1.13), alpha chain [Pyrococcus abyssi GE5]CCE70736.1 TPA: Acetyl-CoA synthetase II (NDP forming), alpha subunit [Pyrococcus abyssi GE5]